MTLYDRLKRLGSSTVSDVLDEGGYHAQTLDTALFGVGNPDPFCGPACCVKGERRVATRTQAGEGCYIPMYALPTLNDAGAVLVFAVGGFRSGAVLGGLIARDLTEANAAGFVTDGCIRDRAELAKGTLPVVAAGGIPTNGARRIQIVDSGRSVVMPGLDGGTVTIHPGDVVLGDADGVVVIPAAIAADVLEMGEEILRKEEALLANLHNMTMQERATARADRMSHVAWLRKNEA